MPSSGDNYPDTGALDEARALVTRFVEHYNTVRLHSAIGYITLADFLAGRGKAIWPSAITGPKPPVKYVASAASKPIRRPHNTPAGR
jgi:hypothetical protein